MALLQKKIFTPDEISRRFEEVRKTTKIPAGDSVEAVRKIRRQLSKEDPDMSFLKL